MPPVEGGRILVTDFEAEGRNHDFVAMWPTSVRNFAELKGYMDQVGNTVVIFVSGSVGFDGIYLQNTRLSDLTSDHFFF